MQWLHIDMGKTCILLPYRDAYFFSRHWQRCDLCCTWSKLVLGHSTNKRHNFDWLLKNSEFQHPPCVIHIMKFCSFIVYEPILIVYEPVQSYISSSHKHPWARVFWCEHIFGWCEWTLNALYDDEFMIRAISYYKCKFCKIGCNNAYFLQVVHVLLYDFCIKIVEFFVSYDTGSNISIPWSLTTRLGSFAVAQPFYSIHRHVQSSEGVWGYSGVIYQFVIQLLVSCLPCLCLH